MDPAAYQLDEDTLERIFIQEIVPVVQQGVTQPPDTRPMLVVLAGQPGSGKSVLRPSIEASFAVQGGALGVSGDEFRPFHPNYHELIGTDDLVMSQGTKQAASWWTNRALSWAVGERLNTVWEDTLWTTQRNVGRLTEAQTAGYHTTVVAMAVPIVRSRLGILGRYVGQREQIGTGRWTTGRAVDTAPFDRIAESLQVLEDNGVADRIAVATREAVVTEQTRSADGTWPQGSPTEALIEARSVPLSFRDRTELRTHLGDLTNRLAALGRRNEPGIAEMIDAIGIDLAGPARPSHPRTTPTRPRSGSGGEAR